MTSCDDGQTWVFNRSDDDSGSCVGVDCDHHPGSSTGLTFGNGYFFASFGWGDNPTRLMRSNNGVAWETVYSQSGYSFAGVAWAGDRLVAGDVTPRYSLNLGASYSASAWPDYQVGEGVWPNARGIGYAPFGGGRILLLSGAGDGSWADTTVSRDSGLTYGHPTVWPSECRGYGRGVAFANNTWLQVWAGRNLVCRSTDGGDTWSTHQPFEAQGGELSNAAVVDGAFIVYQDTTGHRSTDGSSWTPFTTNERVEVVAASASTGTLVMTRNGWGSPYSEQRMFRSTDGATWQSIPLTAFVQSHPITHITFGYGQPGTQCPAR